MDEKRSPILELASNLARECTAIEQIKDRYELALIRIRKKDTAASGKMGTLAEIANDALKTHAPERSDG